MCWGESPSIPERPSDDEMKCKKCGESWAPENHYSCWYYNQYKTFCRKLYNNKEKKDND